MDIYTEVKNVVNEDTGEVEEVIVDEAALADKLVEAGKKVSEVFPVEGKYSDGLKKRIAERRKQLGK